MSTTVTQSGPIPAEPSHNDYRLPRDEPETRRLMLQHQVYRPFTERLLRDAGIGPGMRVIDLGSGAGDVAMLCADIVGPAGAVVGLDVDEAILARARDRAEREGRHRVWFHTCDLRELSNHLDARSAERLGGPVDAIVGRWILMHLPNPVATISTAARWLRPGGLVVFQDSDFDLTLRCLTHPELPLHRTLADVLTTISSPSTPGMRGLALFDLFQGAGLPAPQLRLDAPLGGGSDWPGYELMAATIRSLLPLLRSGGSLDPATEALLDPETLAERLRDEVVGARGVQMLPTVIGAWTRV